MSLIIILGIAVWFGIGIVLAPFAYATDFAYWQSKFPELAVESYKRDRANAMFFPVLCTILTWPTFFWMGYQEYEGWRYGLKWK